MLADLFNMHHLRCKSKVCLKINDIDLFRFCHTDRDGVSASYVNKKVKNNCSYQSKMGGQSFQTSK